MFRGFKILCNPIQMLFESFTVVKNNLVMTLVTFQNASTIQMVNKFSQVLTLLRNF